ncbi:hypothetical protein [Mucilaginibacter xinganensis]|uniref:Uncharacterized protein n=1 Tax=Mucilaginibacter xinganensis TaxID=1234841 RepID=A0A223NQG8_9SPHI|nr:hypothetical protein [Mucilaginibacter xinganensis]ASU32000.1 hypothetical protein MuYL_0097 [Mucilaginibacter xinganensis]
MDRTLKIYTKTDHLFAEFIFQYDHPGQATAHYVQYRRLYNDDEEDENKSVYPLMEMDTYLSFRQFDSIEQIKAHDIEVVKKELGRDMTDPRGYKYVYNPTPVLLRYIVTNRTGGMVNVLFSFIDNTKEVKFLSAVHPRFDFELSADSLETNISCISRIPVYTDRDVYEIRSHDLKRLEPWY